MAYFLESKCKYMLDIMQAIRYNNPMNQLSLDKRTHILNLLLEGTSMRSASRIVGVSINTVSKLLVDVGEACAKFHDEAVREVQSDKVQCDEIWSFCYAKAKNAPYIMGHPEHAGSVWTWTGIDVASRMIVSWHVSIGRDKASAIDFMQDLAGRLARRVTLSTDGLESYVEAVEQGFGGDVDYGQLVKQYEGTPQRYAGAERTVIVGSPAMSDISTSYIERHNLTTRMAVRRYARRTNAYSKKFLNHCHMLAIFYCFYNYVRPHSSLKNPYPRTPAMVAGLADQPYEMEWLVGLAEANAPEPKKRGPYKKREKAND